MCFAPQRRAHFWHLNFQEWSGAGVFCTFWLRNVVRATTACNFSFLIWPAGSAPAALASLLFDPPEPQIIGKTQCFATFLLFRAPASSFFWLFLFSDLLSSALLYSTLLFSTLLFPLNLPISAFHLSILSEVWLLNFLRLKMTNGHWWFTNSMNMRRWSSQWRVFHMTPSLIITSQYLWKEWTRIQKMCFPKMKVAQNCPWAIVNPNLMANYRYLPLAKLW